MMSRQKQSLEKWTRLWQPAGLSSHWTIALAERWYLILLLLVTGFHLALGSYFPPVDDELYYWTWSKNLSPSYYDHSPMVAYLISFATWMFGDNLFAIRFFASILSFLILWIVAMIVPGKQILILLIFCPVFLFGGHFMTPDLPMLFFWTTYLIWLMHLSTQISQWSDDPITRVWRKAAAAWPYWTLGGILLGLGILSKYTMLMALPISFIALFLRYRTKAWLGGFVLHSIVAGLFCLPILYFNHQWNWEPLLFQWHHGMSQGSFSLNSLFNFIGSQVLLIGALPFVLAPFIIKARKELGDNPELYICLFFFLLPLGFFMFQALRNQVEANWALMAYLAFWPLAQTFLDRSSFRHVWAFVTWISFLVPFAASLLFAIHINHPIGYLTPRSDRYHYFKARRELFLYVKKTIDFEPIPFFSNSYQNVASLQFAGIPAEQIPDWGRRSQYSLTSSKPCSHRSIYVFSEQSLPNELFWCFSKWREIATLPLLVRGELIHTYHLRKYEL